MMVGRTPRGRRATNVVWRASPGSRLVCAGTSLLGCAGVVEVDPPRHRLVDGVGAALRYREALDASTRPVRRGHRRRRIPSDEPLRARRLDVGAAHPDLSEHVLAVDVQRQGEVGRHVAFPTHRLAVDDCSGHHPDERGTREGQAQGGDLLVVAPRDVTHVHLAVQVVVDAVVADLCHCGWKAQRLRAALLRHQALPALSSASVAAALLVGAVWHAGRCHALVGSVAHLASRALSTLTSAPVGAALLAGALGGAQALAGVAAAGVAQALPAATVAPIAAADLCPAVGGAGHEALAGVVALLAASALSALSAAAVRSALLAGALGHARRNHALVCSVALQTGRTRTALPAASVAAALLAGALGHALDHALADVVALVAGLARAARTVAPIVAADLGGADGDAGAVHASSGGAAGLDAVCSDAALLAAAVGDVSAVGHAVDVLVDAAAADDLAGRDALLLPVDRDALEAVTGRRDLLARPLAFGHARGGRGREGRAGRADARRTVVADEAGLGVFAPVPAPGSHATDDDRHQGGHVVEALVLHDETPLHFVVASWRPCSPLATLRNRPFGRFTSRRMGPELKLSLRTLRLTLRPIPSIEKVLLYAGRRKIPPTRMDMV